MPIKTNSTILAVNIESVEGTPVLATAGSQVVPLREGFSFGPAQEVLTNDELRAGIGSAADVPGVESGESEIPFFLRHSGVEGQESKDGKFYHSLFGAKTVNATEYDTAAGSTVSVIAMPVGEGANFERGQALLVKNSVREIRAIESISGDNLTLAFNLPVAPSAAGINLGKAIVYKPANDGHPSLTLDMYRGNGGIREVISGGRVSEMSIEVNAGEFIQGSFSIQGTKYYFDAIEITATSKYLDFDDGAVKQLVLTEKVYRDPHELAQAIQDAFNVASSGWTVIYNDKGSDKGKFRISKASGTATLLWDTGVQTANTIGTKLGYDVSSDDSGFLFYVSDLAQDWSFQYTPAYDSEDPLVAKGLEILLGDSATDISSVCVQSLSATINNTINDVNCIRAETGVDSKNIEKREATLEFTITADQHDAEIWKQFRSNTTVKFQFNFGRKSGGNWQQGRSGCLYFAAAKLTEMAVEDDAGLVIITGSIKAFVGSSVLGEVYLNFV